MILLRAESRQSMWNIRWPPDWTKGRQQSTAHHKESHDGGSFVFVKSFDQETELAPLAAPSGRQEKQNRILGRRRLDPALILANSRCRPKSCNRECDHVALVEFERPLWAGAPVGPSITLSIGASAPCAMPPMAGLGKLRRSEADPDEGPDGAESA